jgi:hypothetical protein
MKEKTLIISEPIAKSEIPNITLIMIQNLVIIMKAAVGLIKKKPEKMKRINILEQKIIKSPLDQQKIGQDLIAKAEIKAEAV